MDDLFVLLINGLVFMFVGSTEPGVLADGANAYPFLVTGQHRYSFGWHKQSDGKKIFQALKPATGGVLIVRSKDLALTDADLTTQAERNGSINVHWGPGSHWSAGCQIMQGRAYVDPQGQLRDCSAFAATGYAALGTKRNGIIQTKGAYTLLADLVTAFSGAVAGDHTVALHADLRSGCGARRRGGPERDRRAAETWRDVGDNHGDMRIRRLSSVVCIVAALAVAPSARPAAAQPGLVTAFTHVATGLTLQYVVQGDPKGPAVVLLHGAGDSWHSWELVLPRLPQTWRTYAVTLRGHGLSDHPAQGYGRADFAADVTSFLTQLNLRDVTLVGHSLGSFVAQVVAQNDSDRRISRLVLIGSGPGRAADPNAPSALRDYFARVTDPIDYQFARDFQAGTAFTPLPAAFLETMIGEVQRVPAAMFHELATGTAAADHVERLRRLTVKTLLVWGDKDAMFSQADQHEVLALIPGARLITYANTGHALHWEQPERFARDLAAFVK